jgi:hypothetical protein
MTSRREFLEVAALSALPAVAGTSLTAGVTETSPDFHFVLFDERYPQARSVATRFSRAGAALHALTNGDVTQVWLNQIGPAWRRGPAMVAGFTARPALFCLEQLALSSGMRVVFHAEHVVHPNGRTAHSLLRGADDLRLSSADLSQAGRNWPERIAEALATYRPQATRPRFGRSDAALDPALPPQAHLLTSWIIAAA